MKEIPFKYINIALGVCRKNVVIPLTNFIPTVMLYNRNKVIN